MGELQKRGLDKAKVPPFEWVSMGSKEEYLTDYPEGDGLLIDYEDFKEVVEEMRKEFPNWREICKEYKEADMPVNQMVDYANARLSQKTQLWFEKWLK